MADQDKSIDFEKKLQDLEALVAKLETGELSLEESLKAYENGIALTRECQGILEKAQLRIEMASTENKASEDLSEGESSAEDI
jgi:exodeoxyribonuclease VII small subunit